MNEADSLPTTLAELPRSILGFDEIEIIVIDDGSTDATGEVALAHGAAQVVRHPQNLGLARTFLAGLEASLARGADIIVNTDADNQYRADDITVLIEPILAGRADIVIGSRPIDAIEHFGPLKKSLEHLGSWVVRKLSGVEVDDAASGFRAYTRSAAMRMNVFSTYTYTLETIMQAGQAGLAVEAVPIRVNPDRRPSRLVKSTARYVFRSIGTILNIFLTYWPFRFFMILGSISFSLGFLIGLRFLIYFLIGEGEGKIQSLIFAAVLMLTGLQLGVVGLIANLIGVNRRLLEEIRRNTR